MFESNQMLQFRPARFAEYMAMSDRRRHSSAVFPGSIREIPTDAETWTVAVPNGSGSAIDRMIAATDFETTLSPTGGIRTANSSPPRRAQQEPSGAALDDLGDIFQDLVADDVAVKVVHLLEEIEIEQKERASLTAQVIVGEHPHQLSPVRKAGDVVDERTVVGRLLSSLVRSQSGLQILRPAPGEQDHRDVQQKCDCQLVVDREARRSVEHAGNDPLADRHEHEQRG